MRAITAVGLALLVALAGCGAVGGGDGGAEPTATPTETPPTGDGSSGDETTSDTPMGTGPNTVAFADLNERQQAAFEAALDGEARFVPNTSYVAASEGFRYDQIGPFEAHDFVRYEGERYRLEFTQGPLYAQYRIDTSLGDPGEDDTVVAVGDLPGEVRDEVRTAIEEGEYFAPAGKWDSLPEPLHDTDYVRYDGETYAMGYTVGDIWAPVMSAERVG